jgi:uncharacterized OB-fold protein
VIVLVCESCGQVVFPPRALCPRCGESSWREEPAGSGTVEEVTRTGEGALASVRLDGGPLVVARVPEDAQPGDRLDVTDA